MEKKLTKLLKESEESFYAACKKAEQLEKDFERCLGYLHYLGIDPMDGSPTAEEIVGMRIQELERKVGEAKAETNIAQKELYGLKQSLSQLSEHTSTVVKKNKIDEEKYTCKKHHLVAKLYGTEKLYKCTKCPHIQGYK